MIGTALADRFIGSDAALAFGNITSATLDSNFFISADNVAQNGTTPPFTFNTASGSLIFDSNRSSPDGQTTLLTVQSGASMVANDLVFFSSASLGFMAILRLVEASIS
jgi:hypothetical protein